MRYSLANICGLYHVFRGSTSIAKYSNVEDARRHVDEANLQQRTGQQRDRFKARSKYFKHPRAKEIRKALLPVADYSGAAVYILQAEGGHYRISNVRSPAKRMFDVCVKLPWLCEPLACIPNKEAKQLKKQLHAIFSRQRVAGEWFKLDEPLQAALLDFIKQSDGILLR